MKKKLLLGTGAIAVMASVCVPAFAYAAAAQNSGDGIQEVVVTANRRSENVQKSALSIQVINSEALKDAGVSKANDLQNAVPGLTTQAGGAQFSTYMRGVGSFATDSSAESSIAYNINGVYISRPSGVGAIFFDIDRIEVLKGPQGTLYGRNASGGAINLISKRPGNEAHGDIEVEIGNYNLRRVAGSIGGPLSDTFGARLALQVTKRDGYLTDGYNDEDSQAGRLTAVWRPSENFSLLGVAEYSHQGGQGGASVIRSTVRTMPSNEWTGPSDANSLKTDSALLGGTIVQADGFLDTEVKAVNLEANWDIGDLKLTIIPAYREVVSDNRTYQPGFLLWPYETSKQTSLEARLSHDGDKLKWVFGAFGFQERQTQIYYMEAKPFQQVTTEANIDTDSWAIFGQATYSLSERLRLTAGLRYSEDAKDQNGQSVAVLPRANTVNNYGTANFNDTSYKVGVEYDIGAQNMLFATLATGYKSGSFFPNVPFPDNMFKPEYLTAYTIGSRNRFFNNNFQANFEAFYWEYKDKQERYLGVSPSGTQGLLTVNAGAATIYGLSSDFVYKMGNGTLRFNLEYVNSNYDDFKYSIYNPSSAGTTSLKSLNPAASGCVLGAAVAYAGTNPVGAPGSPPYNATSFLLYDSTQSVDCSGKSLPHAPEWSGSIRYDYKYNLANGDRIVPAIGAQFASEMYLSPDYIESSRMGSWVTFDANLSYESQHGWTITAWGRNLSDEAVYSGGFRFPFSVTDVTTFAADIRAPRTYGLTVQAKF